LISYHLAKRRGKDRLTDFDAESSIDYHGGLHISIEGKGWGDGKAYDRVSKSAFVTSHSRSDRGFEVKPHLLSEKHLDRVSLH